MAAEPFHSGGRVGRVGDRPAAKQLWAAARTCRGPSQHFSHVCHPFWRYEQLQRKRVDQLPARVTTQTSWISGVEGTSSFLTGGPRL